MLLSIVMMIKNESEILDKTLNALKILNRQINTELIIMDTGSEDNSVEIAKKYTDKVYFEKWNGNFSDMRNKSIGYVNGDWILVLDADEVLIDSKKLIEFFTEGKFKTYNSASIKLKNLYNLDKSNYGYSSIVRLFKNDDIKFEGKIHEQATYRYPVYNDIAEFEHYGYIFEDDEKRIQKLKRNEKLLLEELHEKPKDPYVRYQLCQNLICEGKIKEAEIECEKSFQLYKKYNITPVFIYETLAKIYATSGKYDKCETLCKEYIKKNKNNIDIYCYLGIARMNKYKFKEAIDSFKRYLYLLENYEITVQSNDFMSECDTISLKEDVLLKLTVSYSHLEKYENVVKTFKLITDEKKKSIAYNYWISAVVELNNEDQLLKYESEIIKSYNDRKNFLNAVECFLSQADDEKKKIIYRKLSNIKGDYGTLNKVRLAEKIDLESAITLLNSSEPESFYGSVLNIVIKNNIDLYELFKDIDTVWIYKYIYYSLSVDKTVGVYLYEYITNSLNSFEFEKIRIYKIFSELVLNKTNLSHEKYKNIMYLYTMYSYQYMKLLYKVEDDATLVKNLGDEDRFVIKFRQLVEYKDKDSIEYVNELKNTSNNYPQHKRIITMLIKEAQEYINEKKEFKELRSLFINNIKQMIENNNIDEARKMIDEYLLNFKEDKSILNIQGIIKMIEGNLSDANIILKRALSLDINNEDLIYNINYLNEIMNNN